jgi:hypothetical protein
MTKFEEELTAKMLEKRCTITVKQYLQRLKAINDGKSLTSLSFLTNVDKTDKKIEDMELKFSTKVSYYTAISATLSCYKKYAKLYKIYQDKMIKMATQLKEGLAKNEKTEQQEKSMIPWDDIITKRKELGEEVEKLKNSMDKNGWEKLLQYVLISLYTMIPPRRVQDYAYMYFVQDYPEDMDDNKNYYVVSQGQFIFNKYKTAHVYGQQIIDAPYDLCYVMAVYIHHHLNRWPAGEEHKLLLNYNGNSINMTAGIGRILNKALGDSVGATALRHIYVSEKFADELKDRKKVANMMAHRLETQAEYIKH